jgi:acyl-coenzyme A synthetase/AMP-(fatty) acid ligase
MGEPLAPSVAKWFSSKFLNKNKAVVNTYFQTETGGIICSPNIIKI